MHFAAFIGDIYQKYEADLIKAIEKYSHENGHIVDIFGNCSVPDGNPVFAEGLKSIFELPDYSAYDGIILASDTLHHFNMNRDLILKFRKEADCPIVNLRSDEKDFYNVCPDNFDSMYKITTHFIKERGIRDFGFVTGRDDMEDARLRTEGFLKACEENGIEIPKSRIFHGDYWRKQGKITADFFMPDKTKNSLPKVIICSNDYMALALSDELISRGIGVPEDVLITGMDNLEEGAVNIPSLTSIDISAADLVDTGFVVINKLINKEEVPHVTYITSKIYYRESSGDAMSADDPYKIPVNPVKNGEDRLHYREYIRLSTLFEDLLSESECIEVAVKELYALNMFDDCRICIKGEKIHSSDGTNLIFPLNFRNDVYGYCYLKLKPGIRKPFDELLEFLLINIGNTIGRIRMYNEVFAAKSMQKLYLKDPLTDLYNRRGFDRKLSDLNDYIRESGMKVAIASIDLDDFKYINDDYGHAAGDDALVLVAKSINRSLNNEEFAVRMGGDEFTAVLIYSDHSRMDRFRDELRSNINTAAAREFPFKIEASIGVCEVGDWECVLDYLKKADALMYEDKKARKNGRIR